MKAQFTSLSQNDSENEAEFGKRIRKASLRTFSGFSLFRSSECRCPRDEKTISRPAEKCVKGGLRK